MISERKFTFVQSEQKSVDERKKNLRKRMKEARAAVDNKDVKERLLIEHFFALLKESGKMDAEKFFVYMSYSSEARTDGLIERLQAEGKKVYAPCIDGREMRLVLVGEDFTLSEKGIREPIGEAYEGEIDVVVLPLLAVDKQGYRLGYGGGYYDRFLQQHTESFTVGYAYDVQVVEEVPKDEWDKKVHAVVTDKRILQMQE